MKLELSFILIYIVFIGFGIMITAQDTAGWSDKHRNPVFLLSGILVQRTVERIDFLVKKSSDYIFACEFINWIKRRKKNLLKCLCLTVIVTVSINAGAQDLKSILSGVTKAVVGDKATTESSILGTWTYTGPECQFESESLLAKASGEVTAKEVEEKMQTVYEKVGMNGCQYVFNEDGSYSLTTNSRTSSGTYTFDNDAKTVTMKSKLGIKSMGYVSVSGDEMSLVFNADRLMSVLKTIMGLHQKSALWHPRSASISESYDGVFGGVTDSGMACVT